MWALVLGTAPILAEVVAESAIPSYGAFMNQPVPRMWSGIVLYPVMWIGLGTAGLRRLRSRGVERAPGGPPRDSLRAGARDHHPSLIAIPFTTLFLFLYDQRVEPLVEILSGRRQLDSDRPGGGGSRRAAGQAASAFRCRRSTFLPPEPYDAKRVLAALIDDTRNAHTVTTLSERLTSEIDRALHVDRSASLSRIAAPAALSVSTTAPISSRPMRRS